MDQPKNLIVIAGPTASGKTGLSLALAQCFSCDILSADSRQVFRDINIGTAKPSSSELLSQKHHFIDHVDLNENYSVGRYEQEVLSLLDKIFEEKDFAILVGGTGFYIRAVLEGIDHFPDVDPTITQKITNEYDEKGISFLQKELQSCDPQYYKQVDLANPHRMIRAIAVTESSGKAYSSFLGQPKAERNFNAIKILLNPPKEILHQRIESRVDKMMAEGLVAEVEKLKNKQDFQSLKTVGYAEIFNHLNGECSLAQATERIKIHTRQYAKRQKTWFKKYFKGEAFEAGNVDLIKEYINKQVQLS